MDWKTNKKGEEIAKKTILLINTGSPKKRFIIQRLKKLGLKVVVLNKEKNWAEHYVDHWIITDPANHSDAILAVKQFLKNHKKVKIDGVVTFWEDDVLLTSKIVDQFNFIGIPYTIARQVRNKFLFREFCKQHGIRAPKHKIIRTREDINSIAKNIPFPMVVKPAFGASSAYVIKVDNKEELLNTVHYIRKNISTETESALSDGMDIFAEEYIDGDEVDIDILLQNGKIKFYSIADNYNKSRDEFFVDNGQAIPSGLPEKDCEELLQMAEEALEKLGIQNGCIHFEAKSTKEGPVPIEINMRMGGDYVYSYVKGAWGVDMIEYAVRIALGMYVKIEKPDEPKKYIVGWDLHPESSGILVELSVEEELREKNYLEEIHLYKEIGDPVLLPPEGYESLGWLTVSGDNLLDAQDNLKDALTLINFSVVKYNKESSLGKTARKNRLSAAVLNKKLLLKAAKIEKVRHATIENRRALHIGIANGGPYGMVDGDMRSTSQYIEKTLRNLGYRVTAFDFTSPGSAYDALRKSDIDLVFNVYQGIDEFGLFKPQVAAMLEVFQIPFTGSGSLTLGLCQDRIRTKKLFQCHNLPTPKWDYMYSLDETISDDLRYPLIVKPDKSDTSAGVTQASVVKNKRQLEKQLRNVIVGMGRPALVEEYIEGDEYDVTIIGNTKENVHVLPLSRSLFNKMPEKSWHIYSQDINERNQAAHGILVQNPLKSVSAKLESLLTEIALDAYNIMKCKDYGRVKIRVDESDNPYVLRVNANPILSPKASFYKTAKLVGLDYPNMLEKIIDIAITRYKEDGMRYFTPLR